MTIEEDAEYEDRLVKRTRERDSLARQLFDIKHRHADYIATVQEAVHETVGGIQIKAVPRPRRVNGPGPLVTVALLSDLQTGKITPDYNSEVCAERVDRYADEVIAIGKAHRSTRVAVPMLGDMVEGTDIFPGQQWLIDSTLYRQIFDTTPVIITNFVRKLLTYFDHVETFAVQGNHGRIGRRGMFGPEDNADRMVYRVAKLLLRDEPRCTFTMSDPEGEAAWYLVMRLGNYSALLIHGDQIRGHSGIPWYGFQKKINSWASGGLPCGTPFLDAMTAHYHQLSMVPLNKRKVWANGSTESTNTYAAEQLAAQSEPGQWTLMVDPVAGHVTAAYPVRLT